MSYPQVNYHEFKICTGAEREVIKAVETKTADTVHAQ